MMLRERTSMAFSSSGPYGLGSVRLLLLCRTWDRRRGVPRSFKSSGCFEATTTNVSRSPAGSVVGPEDIDVVEGQLGGLGPGPDEAAVAMGRGQCLVADLRLLGRVGDLHRSSIFFFGLLRRRCSSDS